MIAIRTLSLALVVPPERSRPPPPPATAAAAPRASRPSGSFSGARGLGTSAGSDRIPPGRGARRARAAPPACRSDSAGAADRHERAPVGLVDRRVGGQL